MTNTQTKQKHTKNTTAPFFFLCNRRATVRKRRTSKNSLPAGRFDEKENFEHSKTESFRLPSVWGAGGGRERRKRDHVLLPTPLHQPNPTQPTNQADRLSLHWSLFSWVDRTTSVECECWRNILTTVTSAMMGDGSCRSFTCQDNLSDVMSVAEFKQREVVVIAWIALKIYSKILLTL